MGASAGRVSAERVGTGRVSQKRSSAQQRQCRAL